MLESHHPEILYQRGERMENRRLLAAIDGSAYSDLVIEKAIEFAELLSAEIVLVYCHKKFPKLLGHPYRNQVISEIMDKTDEVVLPYVTRLKASGVKFVERFMEGPAGKMIPTVAEHENCEMIILGSRGLSNLEGLIIGSVTHKVLHMAHCPVLVVK